jgi:rhamnosyltransferase
MKIIGNIGIATVFYNPDREALNMFKALSDYGYVVVVANNGMDDEYLTEIKQHDKIVIVGAGVNVGLARAMNDAINKILQENINIEGFVQFDQDSKPDFNLPISLRNNFCKYSKTRNIGCIGPKIRDKKSLLKNEFTLGSSVVNVLTIATSGTYMTREVFNRVGSLNEGLFIDCVDHEWCFRARNLGLEVLIDESIEMIHDMGEDGIDFFGTYKPIYRSPVRHYYIIRNTIYILGLNYVPLSWKITEFLKTFRRILFYIIYSIKPIHTIRNIIRGIAHGLIGRLGAID